MGNLRFLYLATTIHKIITTKTLVYLYKNIKFCFNVHDIHVHNTNLLTPPEHSTALFERFFTYNVLCLDRKL